ncbi:hypothetical protein GCM10020358_09010 [Amorphoplanes nipponensis]
MVDHVGGPAADADHPAVLDGDVAPAAVAAQQTGARDPPVHVRVGQAVLEVLVDPGRPDRPAGVGRAGPPDVGDAIDHRAARLFVLARNRPIIPSARVRRCRHAGSPGRFGTSAPDGGPAPRRR